MKIDYYRINNNSLRIIFPKYLTREIFEIILIQCYSKSSSNKDINNVTFSFQALLWIDIFEVSLISLWIQKLISRNKKIYIEYPISEKTSGFLHSFKFFHFTESITSSTKSSYSNIGQEDTGTIFFPLTFLNKNDFELLLDDLNYKNRLKEVFKEISEIELIKSGKLRDIIITELGENMYIHGEGKNASIIATSYKPIDLNKVQDRINLSSYFEKKFFRIIGNQPYIEIVISDNGKGIYKKLIDTYREDISYARHKANPSHADLMEYAFLPYTSSRDVSERLNFIDKTLDSDTINNPPVTGLNKLQLIVREFRGMILVKSGKGIICYDFLTERDLVFPLKNDDVPKFRNLVSFDGVQYKILIPLNKPISAAPIRTKFQFQETQIKFTYIYKRLDDYFDSQSKYLNESAKRQYLAFEQAIDNYHLINSSKNIILIFDLCEAKVINQKLLHLVILKLSQAQSNKQINSFINLPSEYIELLNYKFQNDKPIVGFDNNFRRIILGVSKEDNQIFNDILSEKEVENTQINSFISKYPNLFDLSSNSFIHNRNSILSFSNQCIRELINNNIQDSKNNIFHPDVKVLIPTNLYCQGYFEIGNLFKIPEYKYLVLQWLKVGFHILKPNVIISLSEHCGEIISELQINYNREFTSIVLKTPIEESSLLKLRLNLDKNSKILIFTDVISSSKTTLRLLDILSSYEIVHIVSIVNASGVNHYKLEKNDVKISQCVFEKIEYFETLPDDWLYSELLLTDPKTNFLIRQDDYRAEGSLLKKFEVTIENIDGYEELRNRFLEDIIIPHNLTEEGHFITNDKHFSYLFNIEELVNKFEHIIVDTIVSHYSYEIKKRQKKSNFDNYILYFSYNPGLFSLCSSLSKNLKRSEIIEINFKKEQNPISQEIKDENVILIDDAFITGGSITDLIDYCELRGARNIFVYILIKRGTTLSARKLEKNKKYGRSRVSVRYLFDSELPNFNFYSCPICKEKTVLTKLQQFISIEHKSFWDYISLNHGNKNERIISSDFKFSNLPTVSNNILIRWKVETSKHELISQMEIIRKLRNYGTNFEFIKSLYYIYSNEKENLLKQDFYSNASYYKNLSNQLVVTGKELLIGSDDVDTSFQNNIIDVIFWLDVEIVNNIFSNIVDNAVKNDNSVFELILIIFKNIDKCPFSLNKFSSIIKNKIEGLHNLQDSTIETVYLFIEFLNSQFNNAIKYADIKRAGIRTLFHESYHEFPRLFETLKSKLIKGVEDANEITSLWEELKEIVLKSIRNLKYIQETGISVEQIKILEKRIFDLNVFITKTETYLKVGYNPTEFNFYSGISDSIIGSNGIQALLSSFRIDLKNIIDFLKDKYKSKFITKNITFFYDKPDYSCRAFGEYSKVITSIDNIFENIYIHSHSSKFVLTFELSEDFQYIILNFYDNGIGGKIKKGVGLNNVTENVKRFLGDFLINSDCEENGFSTHVILKLINLDKEN
jgi:hypothetical protein